MPVRVLVEEWNLGDWGRSFAVGDQVRFHVYEADLEGRAFVRRTLGSAGDSITHFVDHSGTRDTFEARGRVTAIYAVYATFPDRVGGTPVEGGGRLVQVDRAVAIAGEMPPDLVVVTSYLFDLADASG